MLAKMGANFGWRYAVTEGWIPRGGKARRHKAPDAFLASSRLRSGG